MLRLAGAGRRRSLRMGVCTWCVIHVSDGVWGREMWNAGGSRRGEQEAEYGLRLMAKQQQPSAHVVGSGVSLACSSVFRTGMDVRPGPALIIIITNVAVE